MRDATAARFSLYVVTVWIALSVACIAVYVRANVPQIDFPYCAGAVLDIQHDPYLAVPLGACEARVTGGNVIPMPLPPYVLAAFRAVAEIAYPVAAQLWRVVVAAATIAAIVALAALTRVPYAVVCAAILPIALRETIPLGQLYPLVLAALAGAAWAFDRGKPRLGGAFVALSMIEPNLGLPACAAAFLIVPRAREALAIGCIAAAVLCLVAVPPALGAEYLLRVLPAQAASEVHWVMQFSITHVLAQAGVADRTALTIGSLAYALMLVAGIALAYRLVRRGASPAVAVLLPAAAVLAGGTYTHVWQYGIAAAAALWLSTSALPLPRKLGIAALLLLSTAWVESGFVVTAILAVVATFTLAAWYSRRIVAGIGAAAVVAFACYGVTFVQPVVGDVTQSYVTGDARELAEAPWSRYVAAANPANANTALLLQLPTWIGLGLVIAGYAAAGRSASAVRTRT